MSKNIGIVTYHDGFNFGAYLQVYALCMLIKKIGFYPVVINYKNKKLRKNEYRCLFGTKRPFLFIKHIFKLYAFKKAHKLLNLGEFTTNPKRFSDSHYDAIIYGSDEIWNYNNPLLGIDFFYFGVGMQNTRKISYAPSCGTLSSETVFPSEIKNSLSSFCAISSRDYNTREILKKNLNINSPVVLDPTFLYDFSSETFCCKENNYILVYTTGFSRDEERLIKKIAKEKGKKLISVGYRNAFCDRNIIGIGPFEFLGYYASADFVITSMFHGTIFALKAQKQFIILVDSYRINKLAYILDKLNIKDRVADTGNLRNKMNHYLDYKNINLVLDREIKKSFEFLSKSLNSVIL